MIREVVFCDICGTEKQQTNHWFVAYVEACELHVKGLKPSEPLHTGAKHLCGQNCLHKLLDEFLVMTMTGCTPLADTDKADAKEDTPRAAIQTAAATAEAYSDEYESSARLITLPETPALAHGFHKARGGSRVLRRVAG
jgi:hypothetical protein